MFRIVRTSNFDKDWYNEEFVNVPPMRSDAAKALCYIINRECCTADGDHIWKVVPKDYKLRIGIVA